MAEPQSSHIFNLRIDGQWHPERSMFDNTQWVLVKMTRHGDRIDREVLLENHGRLPATWPSQKAAQHRAGILNADAVRQAVARFVARGRARS